MQGDMELRSGSAVRSGPARSGNGGYESYTYRQKQRLEIPKLLLIRRFFGLSACYIGICQWWFALGAGPAAIVYGMILSTVGNLAIACSLAELASLYMCIIHGVVGIANLELDRQPTAGAQYHWSYFLAPYGRFISFFQRWITVFSWSALVCIAPYFIGTQIQGIVVLADPTKYELVRWCGTLLMWAVAIIPIIIHVFARHILGDIEVAAVIMHWDTFVEGLSGWQNPGVVFSIGFLGVITTLPSVEGVIHMAEEVKNAKVVGPRSMIYGTLINGVIAFSYLFAILYCMGDYTEALSSPTGYPIITISYQATGSKAATYVLMTLGMLPGWIALFKGLASVTRLTWAFARDNGLPFSDFFAVVDPTYKIPFRALYLVASCIFALSLSRSDLRLHLTLFFRSAHSVSIFYLIPLVLLVLKRFTAPHDIPRGTFSLGNFGLSMNLLATLFATLFATYFSIFLPFPATLPVPAENMKYAGPVLGFVMLCACGDWIAQGRHKWQGPTIRHYDDRNE